MKRDTRVLKVTVDRPGRVALEAPKGLLVVLLYSTGNLMQYILNCEISTDIGIFF